MTAEIFYAMAAMAYVMISRTILHITPYPLSIDARLFYLLQIISKKTIIKRLIPFAYDSSFLLY